MPPLAVAAGAKDGELPRRAEAVASGCVVGPWEDAPMAAVSEKTRKASVPVPGERTQGETVAYLLAALTIGSVGLYLIQDTSGRTVTTRVRAKKAGAKRSLMR